MNIDFPKLTPMNLEVIVKNSCVMQKLLLLQMVKRGDVRKT